MDRVAYETYDTDGVYDTMEVNGEKVFSLVK